MGGCGGQPEQLRGIGQPPLVPREEAEGVVGLEEVGVERPAALERERLFAETAGGAVVAPAPGGEAEPGEGPRLGGGLLECATAGERGGP